jgi:hypothetical protein
MNNASKGRDRRVVRRCSRGSSVLKNACIRFVSVFFECYGVLLNSGKVAHHLPGNAHFFEAGVEVVSFHFPEIYLIDPPGISLGEGPHRL